MSRDQKQFVPPERPRRRSRCQNARYVGPIRPVPIAILPLFTNPSVGVTRNLNECGGDLNVNTTTNTNTIRYASAVAEMWVRVYLHYIIEVIECISLGNRHIAALMKRMKIKLLAIKSSSLQKQSRAR